MQGLDLNNAAVAEVVMHRRFYTAVPVFNKTIASCWGTAHSVRVLRDDSKET